MISSRAHILLLHNAGASPPTRCFAFKCICAQRRRHGGNGHDAAYLKRGVSRGSEKLPTYGNKKKQEEDRETEKWKGGDGREKRYGWGGGEE